MADDTPVFLGLISDLFPNLDVPRKRDQEFEKAVKNAACDLKLQPEENFIMKIVQLEEILFVRHSVFVVGDAGTGKTQTWRTLFRTYQNLKKKPVYADLNPKARIARFISVFISMISTSSYSVHSCLTAWIFSCLPGRFQRRAVRDHQPGDKGVEGRLVQLHHARHRQPAGRGAQVDSLGRRHRPHVDRIAQHGHG